MRTQLSTNGPELSRIALGCMRLRDWGLSSSGLRRRIEECVELGVTTFDHADIYGDYSCEELFGEALSGIPRIRPRIQLVTKCGIVLVSPRGPGASIKHYDTSGKHIVESAENSLRRLRTDYIDLLLIHRPDPMIDVDEVAEAFAGLRDSGKVRYFGVSNFTHGQFDLLASRMPFPLVTNQVECSVLETAAFTDGTIEACTRRRIAPMAWSPLGGGELFTGRSERVKRIRKALEEVAGRPGEQAVEETALAWLLRHPAGIAPVIGTGKLERIERAVRSLQIEISREDWFRIWTASQGRDVP